MRKMILPIVLLLILGLPQILFSQGLQNDYFPDRLIIKYESDQKLQQLRTKTGEDPKAAVQQMLNLSGMKYKQPLLSRHMQQVMRTKNLPAAREVLRIEEVAFNRSINPVQLASKISRMPGVEYAEPKYIRRMDATPNDPNLEKFIEYHNFNEAWDISQGSSDIVIAIVDGGVDYTHPDLDNNLWINQEEVPDDIFSQVDQNGDDKVTASEVYQYLQDNDEDYNGDGSITLEDALHEDSDFMDNADNDDNNLIDDLFGWDFWVSGSNSQNISQDNNPIHDATNHGTHVAGIAAAETNNGEGVAGAAYNATFMPVKAGGAPGFEDAIGFGYDGILYAADKGADIINCSWSGGSASEAEEDVVELANQMGSLVVAAAGNESSNTGYPARYDKSLAVGSVETNDNRASYSNFGYDLDVLATGTDILSTITNDDNNDGTHGYISNSGTSMSTPVVSGLAALVKEQHPDWDPERIGMQIRTSATYIDDSNQNLENQLGHGSINAERALETNLPGLKIVSAQFLNENGEKLSLDEEGNIEISITNVGNTTSNLEMELLSLNESDVSLENTQQELGSFAKGDTVDFSIPIHIPIDFSLTEIPTFKLEFRDSNQDYEDFNAIIYEDMFFEVLAGNRVKTSFGADGTLGFSDPLSGRGGVGFIPRYPDGSGGYEEGNNLLFEGGLMVQINDQLYDAVRSITNQVSRDFLPKDAVTVSPTENNDGLRGSTQFETLTDSVQRAEITLETFAFDDPDISNVVFAKYVIRNPSQRLVMKNVYAALFNDWDIGNADNNSVSFSESDSLLYISDASSSGNQPVAAVAHLGPQAGALAIDNSIEGRQDSITFGIYDGFTDNEKKATFNASTERTEIQNADVSAVTSSGPYTINPGAEITVGFAYAFGDDLEELRDQIANARARNLFDTSPTGRIASDERPQQTELFQNYPNPFNAETEIHFDLQEDSQVTLAVYDVLGRKVRVLVDDQLEAGAYFFTLNAQNLSSGTYFAHLETERGTKTIPMTKVRTQ